MSYETDEAKNKRVQKVVDDFMLAIAEKEYISKNGHSLRSEKFANFLINSAPDGMGVFVFEEGSPWPLWKYTKMMGMVAFEGTLLGLYRSLDEMMSTFESHSLTFMTIPFDDEHGVHPTQKNLTVYHIQGENIRPFDIDELRDLAVAVDDLNLTFYEGGPWSYDAYGPYTKLDIS